MKAVIVTGDRYAERNVWFREVERALDQACGLSGSLFVIDGGAEGIDAMASDLAFDRPQYSGLPLPAQWKKHGKPAGPRRNMAMLTVLQICREHGYDIAVLAFHDDLPGSKGTKDMVNQAVRAGVETWHYTTFNEPVQVTEVIR